MSSSRGKVILASTLVFLCTTANASLLSDITGVNVDLNEGTVSVDPPRPEEIPGIVQHTIENFPNVVEGTIRDLFNPAGVAFATAIRHAQGQARHGARSIPANVRGQLAGIVPDHVLNDASWNSLDTNRIDLANLTLLHNNSVGAITVGNVIVFDRLEDANNNWKLWAHELLHTMQYSSMGIEGFAHGYMADSSGMERDATNFANMVEERVAERTQNGATQPIPYYQGSNADNSAQYFQHVQSAARRYAPATACLDIDDYEMTVTNVCNTAVWVSSFVEVNRQTGQRFEGRCTPSPYIRCDIAPGQTLPIVTPNRGCQAEVRFSFFSGGGGSQEGLWEGDCSEYERDDYYEDDFDDFDDQPQQQLGQSCCMFNGGRCGPFTNQPALPLGASCTCWRGDPRADGEVCRP
jgi:hypothetical protein